MTTCPSDWPRVDISKHCRSSFLLELGLILDFCLVHEEQMEKHAGTPEQEGEGQCWRSPPLRRMLFPLASGGLCALHHKMEISALLPSQGKLRTEGLILMKASYKYKVA